MEHFSIKYGLHYAGCWQVRKMSQATLLVLMEQGLVEQSEVEQKVCPVVLRLTEMDHLMMEFHTGAVAVRVVCQSAKNCV
jgi:hypothetical protein